MPQAPDDIEVIGQDGREKGYDTPQGAVAEAIAFQKLSSESFFMQRRREEDDLEFQVPEKQWPDDVRQARQGQSINNVPVPARPMLSIPILDQPIQLQYNGIEKADLAVQVHPRNTGATQETADILQEMYRAIQTDPAHPAAHARLWAADRALKCGWGCYRVLVQYDETADDPRDQKIVISRILHQSSVFFDPFAQLPDFSDANHALIVSFVPWETFKRDYPKSKLQSYGADTFSELLTDYPFWINGTGESRAVCVAEYFCRKFESMTWVLLQDGRFVHADRVPEGAVVEQTDIREFQRPYIEWYKVNAVEELEPKKRWMGTIIPIVPVIGIELQPFQGSRMWAGMITKNKDAARLVNYEVSNAVERDALSPKAPYVGAVGQFKTMRKQWDQANVRNWSTLEYDPVAAGGQMAPPPQRNIQSVDLSSALQLVELAKSMVQVGTASTDATTLENLAKKRVAKETIAGLAGQSEFGNSHFLQNLATISMPLEARIVLELMPEVYDRPERVMKVIGVDGDAKLVMLNAPFVTDPNTKRPVAVPPQVAQQMASQPPQGPPQPGQPPQPPQPSVKQYDLKAGSYDYVIDIGKSHKTRMQAGSDALSTLIAAQPQLIQLLGDIWANFQDFPGHQEIAKRFKAMLPPQVQQMDQAEDQSPEQLRTQLAQATQMVQQLSQQLQQASKMLETEAIKQGAETQRNSENNQTKLQIEAMKAEVDKFLAGLKAQGDMLKIGAKAHADAVLQDDEQQHEMALKSADAEHQTQVAEQQARFGEASARTAHTRGEVSASAADRRAGEQAERQAERDAEMAERQAERDAEMAERDESEE